MRPDTLIFSLETKKGLEGGRRERRGVRERGGVEGERGREGEGERERERERIYIPYMEERSIN